MKIPNTFQTRAVITVLVVSAITLSTWWAMDDPSSSHMLWLGVLWVVGVAVSLLIAFWRRHSLN